MITFTNTIRINRPVADVYAYLSDLEHTPEWNWAITNTAKTTAGPVAVGTRYQQTRTSPRPETETLEITALDVDRHIEVRGTLAALPARLSYDLHEIDNATELTNTVTLEPHGPLRLAAPVMRISIKHAVADNLDKLKIRLDGP
ncbi:MAG: hypothetical protein GY698_14370 [Actinomycetia bacterium]|nr:hypothetical protein [Actinomycetes bacterium]